MAVGLGPTEALGLRWGDVELTEGIVHVRRALERRDGEFVFKETSRGPVGAAFRCQEYASTRYAPTGVARSKSALPPAPNGRTAISCSPHRGEPLHRSEVSRQFCLPQEQAGDAHRRLYDCRHTAASLLLAQGVSPGVVMETLGHSSFALTMDTYTHVLPTLVRDAADAMDRPLPSTR